MTQFVFKIMALMAIGASAHADYFKCQIEQSGQILAQNETDYRVLKTQTVFEDLICSGKLTQDGTTEVKFVVQTTGQTEVSRSKGSASVSISPVPRHNEFDIHCICGLN